jgi:hypothetical protein
MRISVLALIVWSLSSSCVTATSSPTSSNNANNKRRPAFLKHPFLIGERGGATSESSLLLGDHEEATESLEVSIPLSQSPTLQKNDAPLMRDISILTDILLDIVNREDTNIHDLYEEFLSYGKQRYVLIHLVYLLE